VKVAALLEREIERQAKRRCAAILRAHADEIEAELERGAA
jgi:hypothetical protein